MFLSANLISRVSFLKRFPLQISHLRNTSAMNCISIFISPSPGILVDDITNATNTTNGSLQTDGGLSVVKSAYIGNNLTVSHNTITNNIIVNNDLINNGTSLFKKDVIMNNNLNILGNLSITGNVTFINSKHLDVNDPIITIGNNITTTNKLDAGILIKTGTISILNLAESCAGRVEVKAGLPKKLIFSPSLTL